MSEYVITHKTRVDELTLIASLLTSKGFVLQRYGGGPPFPPESMPDALHRDRLLLFERPSIRNGVLQVRLDVRSMIWHVHLETLECSQRGRGYVHLLHALRER